MQKAIITIIAFFMLCSNTAFGQSYKNEYVILPKEGNSIKPDRIEYKNETTLLYFIQNSRNEILIDNISIIYDKDANEVDIANYIEELKNQKIERDKQASSKLASQAQTKEQTAVLQKTINNNSEPANIQISPYRGCGFEIMLNDLPDKMVWGTHVCPQGWRLPTVEELECMCKRKKIIENFNGKQYWSSGKYKKGDKANSITFNDCEVEVEDVGKKYSCRCIRDFR
jgi:hypothetical protein